MTHFWKTSHFFMSMLLKQVRYFLFGKSSDYSPDLKQFFKNKT
jgi:hypothetical protein